MIASEMEVRQVIAKNLIGLRKKRGLSQAELAEVLGYSDKAISKWERGQSLPDAEMLYRLASFYGVNVNYLFEEHDYILTKEENEAIKKKQKRLSMTIVLTILSFLFLLGGVVMATVASTTGHYGPGWTYLFAITGISLIAGVLFRYLGHRKWIGLLFYSLAIWCLFGAFWILFPKPIYSLWFFFAALGLEVILVLLPTLNNQLAGREIEKRTGVNPVKLAAADAKKEKEKAKEEKKAKD